MELLKKLTVSALIFLSNLAIGDQVFGQSFNYKFNYLTVDEGLSHTDANDIAQDNKGYIWTGTNFGLNRFDGYVNKKYYNNNLPLQNAYTNRIRFVYPDNEGKIWLGTEGGLQYFDPASERYVEVNEINKNTSPYLAQIIRPAADKLYGLFDGTLKCYSFDQNRLSPIKINLPKAVRFWEMVMDKNGNTYLSSNKGLWMMDQDLHFHQLSVNGKTDQDFKAIYLDNNHNLVTNFCDTLLLTSRNKGQLYALLVAKKFVDKHVHDIKNIAQNGKADYWINTGRGLIRLDQNFGFIQTVNSQSAQFSLNSSYLNRVIIDRSGCLWLSTFGGGVNYCDLNEKLFHTLKKDPENSNSLSGNYIRSVFADGNNLWIGTMTNGLNLYNLKTGRFTFYNTYNSAIRLKNDAVTSIINDKDKNLWIGTNNGFEILNPERTALIKPKGYEQFPTYVIETIAVDYFGNIWFGNHVDKFGVIVKNSQNVYQVKYYGEGYFIQADQNRPQLFVSSTRGLKKLTIDAQGNITKTVGYRGGDSKNTLSSDYTYPVVKENDNTYWIGTIGGGLNRLSLSKTDNDYAIKVFGSKYGVFNDVESLEIDNEGHIWMGGNGLECLNPKTGKLIRYDKNDGLQGNSFKVGSSFKAADGRLYFGGISGLSYFYPKEIRSNPIAAKPILTDILINNQKYNNQNHTLENSTIGYAEEIKIDYQQNNFTIYFSAMHFANPLKCSYRYKLIGFDSDWKYTDGKNPSAAYNNLDFKPYKFVLQASNNDGIWSKVQAEASILITPPWWKSNLAKLFYILISLSALSAIYIFQGRWYRLKREIAVREVNENKREEMHKQREELSEQQLVFFTNISHELRTPLTLMLGPLENLISRNQNPVLNHSYHLMFRNARRLLNLVSELVNFRKVADKTIKLQVEAVEIEPFLLDLAKDFEALAEQKDIRFEINKIKRKDGEAEKGLIDKQILEKILLNLLNNAFKYTANGGKITFGLFYDIHSFKPHFETGFQLLHPQRANHYIYFKVLDSGIGISPESITKIFDRYYRISTEHLGSGIGLALVKSLTELHKGDIYVYSERNKGTEIIIGIPFGEENYREGEKRLSDQPVETRLELTDTLMLLPSVENGPDIHRKVSVTHKRILLVEDNKELRQFLKQTLDHKYTIIEAEDGKKGLELAIETIPDLIISDVMMPEMNGIEFCRLTKEKFETSHIPFIILSAKDALEAKIEGMESGADFYFSKPFSTELLLLTVQNIFEQAEKLKERYTKNYLAEATELVHNEKDKAFINQILNLIETHIKDPNLDVDFLCSHLFISRTKLYQKIKGVSDQSVAEFIRTIRLKKAIQMMTHEDIALYEVAERIGLQSSSNFSRAFKKEYGKSPLQYIQDLKKK